MALAATGADRGGEEGPSTVMKAHAQMRAGTHQHPWGEKVRGRHRRAAGVASEGTSGGLRVAGQEGAAFAIVRHEWRRWCGQQSQLLARPVLTLVLAHDVTLTPGTSKNKNSIAKCAPVKISGGPNGLWVPQVCKYVTSVYICTCMCFSG